MAGDKLLRGGFIALVLAASAQPVAAQPLPAGKSLTLAEAVRISLDQAPVIRAANEGVAIRRGAVRQAQGAFDALLQVTPAFTHEDDDIGATGALGAQLPNGGTDRRLSKNWFSAVVSLAKPLRTGTTLRLDGTFSGGDSQFTPPLGLLGNLPNVFVDRFQGYWVQPLMRGRGAEAVRAAELSAGKDLEASQFDLQQTNADQVLTTIDGYLSLVSARETMALLRQSLDSQRALLESTVKLVAAGELPRSEVTRATARVHEGEARLLSTQAAVLSAQGALADALGLPADSLTALTASDALPLEPPALELDALLKDAVARRADVNALSSSFAAARILQAGARADLRPRLDLTVSGGTTKSHYGSVPGLKAAGSTPWGAVVLVECQFELPFGNNQRGGRFQEATSSAKQAEIRLADLGRRVRDTAGQYAEDVRRARLEWTQRQEAVTQYEVTWATAQRLRAAGELTLIDTLLTEQLLTTARLGLVEAKRTYASALARFRREVGALVTFADGVHGQPDLAGLTTSR